MGDITDEQNPIKVKLMVFAEFGCIKLEKKKYQAV